MIKINTIQPLFSHIFSKKKLFQIFIFFLLFSYNWILSQNITPKQIDSISKASLAYQVTGDIDKFLNQEKYLNKKSKDINYSRGIAMSYFQIGVAYQMLGDCDKAIDYFNLCKKEVYTKKTYGFQSEIDRSTGECYSSLKLYKEAIPKHKSAIELGIKADGGLANIYKAHNYVGLGTAFENIPKQLDSAYFSYSKALYYINLGSEILPIQQQNALKSLILANLGWTWDSKKNSDSARYYFIKAAKLNKSANNITSNIEINYMIGTSFLKSKEYQKAIEYLQESIKYAAQTKDINTLRDGYQYIAQAYKGLKDDRKYIEFTDLYIKTNKEIEAITVKATHKSIDNIVKDKEGDFQKSKSRFYWIIGGIILLAFLVLIFAFWFHQNMKRKKDDAISDSELRLAQKRKIIEQKEQETHQLKLKINESFEEVVQLAKENSPEFLIRFQEVYPDYHHKLINIEPKLLTTEIKLCSMIYLGFSTKDIAEYTFVTIKAAQHRKFRLRKKLNMPSDIDINAWLEEMKYNLKN